MKRPKKKEGNGGKEQLYLCTKSGPAKKTQFQTPTRLLKWAIFAGSRRASPFFCTFFLLLPSFRRFRAMDRQLMKLSKSPNRTELCKYVEEIPLDQVPLVIHAKLSRPPEDADPVLVLRALFLGKHVCGKISKSAKLLTHVVNVLSPELEMLETCHLDVVGTMVVECIEQGIAIQSRVFDLMAKVYNLLCALDAVDMATTLLQRLCQCEWNPQSSVGLASCLNDLEMPTAHMDIAVKRLVKQLKLLEIDEIPPYIYQLLILGTVMLHMSFAIKQDTELGMELIKYLRTDKKLLMNTFKMAYIIYDLLKNSIITIYKDGEKLAVHRWVAEFSSFDAASVRATMMDIVDKSESGWDQVIQSTIHLAMLLIDTAANAGTRSSDAPVFAAKTKQKYLNDVIQLGVDVIARMFKLHDVARTEILEQIASRVVSRSPSAMFFLQLMEKVVLECRESIGKNISQVKRVIFIARLVLAHSPCRYLGQVHARLYVIPAASSCQAAASRHSAHCWPGSAIPRRSHAGAAQECLCQVQIQ
ncbi:hypothetical protein BC940DRAFT_240198 [Gongronella butleri]|nr:hypothetical protein BC940DRAFT_240198 [Gongronella butleri]